mmetsp:Transcript_32386/g.52451  ORF Transcript_32386/g.52451 Transcript_32386/m.52451 type:complete len:242 (-) Transcript_32386:106-831(-)
MVRGKRLLLQRFKLVKHKIKMWLIQMKRDTLDHGTERLQLVFDIVLFGGRALNRTPNNIQMRQTQLLFVADEFEHVHRLFHQLRMRVGAKQQLQQLALLNPLHQSLRRVVTHRVIMAMMASGATAHVGNVLNAIHATLNRRALQASQRHLHLKLLHNLGNLFIALVSSQQRLHRRNDTLQEIFAQIAQLDIRQRRQRLKRQLTHARNELGSRLCAIHFVALREWRDDMTQITHRDILVAVL